MRTTDRRGDSGPGGSRRLTIVLSAAVVILVAGVAAAAMAVTGSHGGDAAGPFPTSSASGAALGAASGAASPTAELSASTAVTDSATSAGGPRAAAASSPGASSSGRPHPSSPAPNTGPGSGYGPTGSAPASTKPGAYLTVDGTNRAASSVGDAFSRIVTVSGGRAPYTWSVTGLPPGVSASPSGSELKISGVTTTSGDFIPTITVTDSSSPALKATPEMPFYVAVDPMTVTVNAPADAYFGEAYSGTVTAAGGAVPYKWSTASAVQGLTLTPDGSTLRISGSPEEYGSAELKGTVSDSESVPFTLTWVLVLTVKPPPPAPLPSAPSSASAAAPATLTSVSPAKLR